MNAPSARSLTLLTLLFFSLAVSACTPPFHSLAPTDIIDPNQDAIVFGHLIIDWQHIQFQNAGDRLGEMTLTVIHETTGEEHSIVCQDTSLNSRFFVTLPPGKYRLVKWVKGKYFRNMYGAFEVGQGEVRYIGTLKWFRGPFDRLHGNLFIDDHFEAEARHFKKRFPNIAQAPDKAIVYID